jgi:hypothetical protein
LQAGIRPPPALIRLRDGKPAALARSRETQARIPGCRRSSTGGDQAYLELRAPVDETSITNIENVIIFD